MGYMATRGVGEYDTEGADSPKPRDRIIPSIRSTLMCMRLTMRTVSRHNHRVWKGPHAGSTTGMVTYDSGHHLTPCP